MQESECKKLRYWMNIVASSCRWWSRSRGGGRREGGGEAEYIDAGTRRITNSLEVESRVNWCSCCLRGTSVKASVAVHRPPREWFHREIGGLRKVNDRNWYDSSVRDTHIGAEEPWVSEDTLHCIGTGAPRWWRESPWSETEHSWYLVVTRFTVEWNRALMITRPDHRIYAKKD